MDTTFPIKASYYQQFDADVSLAVPGEGYGGWGEATIELSRQHTGFVVMHAWDAGTPEQYPGWYRAVDYLPRANRIVAEVFPALLAAIRGAGMPVYHVVGSGDYYKQLPGYKRAVQLTPEEPAPAWGLSESAQQDEAIKQLREFRRENVFVGKHNEADVDRGFKNLDFPENARPGDDEGVAENAAQLAALCRADNVNHLIYMGFAINWCLLKSPGGMLDMGRRGLMCSAIREATTAVENKETARDQLCKQIALWRVALAYGFVFGADDVIAALKDLPM